MPTIVDMGVTLVTTANIESDEVKKLWALLANPFDRG